MKEDKALRDLLAEKMAIIQNKLPKHAQKEVEKIMFEKFNVQSGRVVGIFNGFERIETVPYHMLYKLAVAIIEVGSNRGDFDYSKLDHLDDYFHPDEKIEYSKPISNKDQDIDIVIEKDMWHETNVGMYSYIDIHSTIDEVIEWFYHGKLRFNPETQRDLIVIETDGMPIYYLDINDKSTDDMRKAMLDGSYFPVPGTININPELYDEYPVKVKNGKLIIERKFSMDLIEGFHNYLSYTSVKLKNKNWSYPCDFRLYLLNTEDANRYILQMDKKNHLKDTQTSRIDTLNAANFVVRSINTSSSFKLRGSINDEMFLYLYDLLPKLFTVNTSLASLLIPKLNTVILKVNPTADCLNKVEWFVYLYIIKQSIDKNILIDKLIEQIDFSIVFNVIKFRNDPSSKHYRLLNNIINEVKDNV
jgi:hypothetical protein